MNNEALISFVNYSISDHNFILATWLRALYSGNYLYNKMPKSLFMQYYHDIIYNIIADETVEIKIAKLTEDDSVILGYSVFRGPVLYWVFVKKAWQRNGIAKMLIPNTITTVNNITYQGYQALKHHPEIVFNPFTE